MSLRSKHLAPAAIAISALFTLSACGTSFNSQTYAEYQAADGANLRQGPVHLYNALFVDNDNGTFTFSANITAGEGTEQKLTAVTAELLSGSNDADPVGAKNVTISLNAPIDLKAGAMTKLGTTAQIVASGSEIKPGSYITVTFTSVPGGESQLDVPVVYRTAMYKNVAKAPGTSPATPSATPTAAAKK